MKNQNLNQGKRLSKKELKTISGGKKICMYNGGCIQIDPSCSELQCRPGVTEVCLYPPGSPNSSKCMKISLTCEEYMCRPHIEI